MAEEKQKKDEKTKRLEAIIYSLAFYLTDLHDEFLDYKHNKIVFGITKAEHKKFFLGK